MASGDITRTTPKTMPALLPVRLEIVRGQSLAVIFLQSDGPPIEVVARNGVCRGWDDNAGQPIHPNVPAGFTNALAAFRTGAAAAATTNLVNRLIADGILVVAGTVE